jgi:hypothetical protein
VARCRIATDVDANSGWDKVWTMARDGQWRRVRAVLDRGAGGSRRLGILAKMKRVKVKQPQT